MDKEKPLSRFSQVKLTGWICLRLFKMVWSIEPKLFAVSIVFTLLPAVLPFVNFYIYKLVIDQVVAIAGGAVFDSQKLYLLIGLRALTYFLQDLAFKTQDLVERMLWGKVPIYISDLIFQKISGLDLQYFENDKFRDQLEKARESFQTRPQNLISSFLYLLQGSLQAAIAIVAIARLNWVLIFLILLVGIPEFINQTQVSKLIWGLWSENASLRKKYGYLQHILLGFREVKEVRLFQLAGKFISQIKQLQLKIYSENIDLAKKNYKYNILFNLFNSTVFIGVEAFVIFQALAKKLTVGDIGFYTGIVSNFQNSLGGIFRNLNGIFDHSLYVKSIFEVLDLKPLITTPQNPVEINLNKSPKIEFRNVSFSYPGSDKKILDNFSLLIEPGSKIAFVGENGAGKSTIIKLLARFYDVTGGQILINDVDLRLIDLEKWYQALGILFQDFNRYDDKVSENIRLGRLSQDPSLNQIIQASMAAGAHQMINQLEKGYEQMLGRHFEGGIELSGGQWQKIALARAFFRNAPVLILDEPTSSLDAKAESEVFETVEKLSKDNTVIIISHRFSTVRNADQIYVIEEGKVSESGLHEELMKLNGRYAQLFNLQARGYK